jgi:hypothetical protein
MYLAPVQTSNLGPTLPTPQLLSNVNTNPYYINSYEQVRNGLLIDTAFPGQTGTIYLPSPSTLCQQLNLTGFNAVVSVQFTIYHPPISGAQNYQLSFTGSHPNTLGLPAGYVSWITIYLNPSGPTGGMNTS